MKYEIYLLLLISTAHIKKETFDALCEDTLDLPAYGNQHGYGAIMCVYPGWKDDMDISDDLAACMRLAEDLHCDYIRFDGDGQIVDGLPTYDW